ncbi:MAG TPA: amylo-alpha-1,6-glucosidase [Chitinophagaceae bacterium]
MQVNEQVKHTEDKFHISADIVNIDDRTKVLNHSNTFAIFNRWGNIHPHGKKVHGIYHRGTRFINKLELRINGLQPSLLSSTIKKDNEILSVDLTNPFLAQCNIEENIIHISRTQFIRDGTYFEEISFVNYGNEPCTINVSLSFSSDFVDIFEIRGIKRNVERNKVFVEQEDHKIFLHYKGLDEIERSTEIIFPGNLTIENNDARMAMDLVPQVQQKISYTIFFRTSAEEKELLNRGEALDLLQHELTSGRSMFPEIITANNQFNHWLNRSRADIISLLAITPYGKYPFAGVPWYNTAFGRDGLITAMETLWAAPEISRDVLKFLAVMQATDLNPLKDAEPGKIMHETRNGEMSNTGEVPFKEYYGTIDATPLFVMLAGMYYERTEDVQTITDIWPNIKAALAWINDYGDLDGDGFVEYKHKAENGLTNQGWKDSYDSIMYEDGELCEPPIALCEVQAYVYGAKKYAAKLALIFNDNELADRMKKEAKEMKKKFNDEFWDEDLGCYVLALDKNKKPCRVVSSNAGQCLFTGITDKSKAKIMAKRLTQEDIYSGWGIRTLSSTAVRYNPMSYHNGSVWPHDNALIAYGLSLYGQQREVLKIMQSLFDASLFIELQRLPELYCGFTCKPNEGPTAYPVACSPQAWSVAAVFMVLQACLKIEINALEKKVIFNKPTLPEYLSEMSVLNLKLGNQNCHFILRRHDNDVGTTILQKPDDWKFIIIK